MQSAPQRRPQCKLCEWWMTRAAVTPMNSISCGSSTHPLHCVGTLSRLHCGLEVPEQLAVRAGRWGAQIASDVEPDGSERPCNAASAGACYYLPFPFYQQFLHPPLSHTHWL